MLSHTLKILPSYDLKYKVEFSIHTCILEQLWAVHTCEREGAWLQQLELILLDEDIIGSNMTMPTTSILKVQPFYMRLIIDAFDELVLHHKMCIFLFPELLTWIKGRFDCIWKAWKVNEVDWGPNPSIPNVLH